MDRIKVEIQEEAYEITEVVYANSSTKIKEEIDENFQVTDQSSQDPGENQFEEICKIPESSNSLISQDEPYESELIESSIEIKQEQVEEDLTM